MEAMLNSMNLRCGLVVAGVLFWGTLSSPAASPSLTTLEELVGQWVDLRGQTATEKRDWDRQAEQWHREIALLREEEQRLDDQLERATQFEAAKESRASDQLARKADLRKALTGVDRVVDRAAAQLSQLLPMIPTPLRSTDITRACRELTDTSRPDSAARRVQLLVGVLGEIEMLQNQNHVARELLELETGQRCEMDVVYLGLARGFAVAPDDSAALQGIPSESGWTWTAMPASDAGAVRTMVRILNEEQPPTLVSVPMASGFPEVQP